MDLANILADPGKPSRLGEASEGVTDHVLKRAGMSFLDICSPWLVVDVY